MDRVDRAILDQLVQDGRIANTELAHRVGLSPSPCLRRVRALEEAGVITGYHAAVDPAALGHGLQVLVHVDMADQRQATVEAFEAAVQQVEEVVSCRRMFGNPDYLLAVAVSGFAAYERLYMGTLTALPGVATTKSQFIMKVVKQAPGHGVPSA
ncbi:Lrp/AsnC family transcriptional regulator [Pseudonocardia sp. ICBG1293]|uniref:Lrp/AsnC family transcriptional regulator n=1 Tax=Pseudonocardia sp. ICBG1293 TaxID=2844382 RepID=UPI001CCC0BEF|nr:Lrp/AsnC family transcriptional regulator [Pseudonocardia sp. ICBG1293]